MLGNETKIYQEPCHSWLQGVGQPAANANSLQNGEMDLQTVGVNQATRKRMLQCAIVTHLYNIGRQMKYAFQVISMFSQETNKHKVDKYESINRRFGQNESPRNCLVCRFLDDVKLGYDQETPFEKSCDWWGWKSMRLAKTADPESAVFVCHHQYRIKLALILPFDQVWRILHNNMKSVVYRSTCWAKNTSI